MNRRQEREIIRTLVEAGQEPLAKQFARSRGYRVRADMKRPGPYIVLDDKPGIWQVVAFQPHTSPSQRRTIGELAWGRIQRVTKKGVPTGKEFYAYFSVNNEVSVAWKGREQLSTTYKEVSSP